jgi:hypothetical protein
LGEDIVASSLGPMRTAVANVAENRRRVERSAPQAAPGESAWKIRPGLIDRLTVSSRFVPVFGNALETTA